MNIFGICQSQEEFGQRTEVSFLTEPFDFFVHKNKARLYLSYLKIQLSTYSYSVILGGEKR